VTLVSVETAVWALIAALVVAVIAPSISHAIKIAEFRQAWINDLRKDVADYIGLCRKWIRIYERVNECDDQTKKHEIEQKELFPTATDALVIFWRIDMRINPLPNEFKKRDDDFIAALRALLAPGALPPPVGKLELADTETRWRTLAEDAVRHSKLVLKGEWERAKRFPITGLWVAIRSPFRRS
jgi:hypothetical protein